MMSARKDVTLEPLRDDDRDQFVHDNQEAFDYGALEEFGRRDDHFEEDGHIISRETIETAIDEGEAYRIVLNGEKVGGLVLKIDGEKGELELLFTSPHIHSKGVGYAAWCAVERMHPEVKVWGLVTPYFETRNIHFYVNRCGFHIVEFFNSHHPDPNDPEEAENAGDEGFSDGMFRFEKRMNILEKSYRKDCMENIVNLEDYIKDLAPELQEKARACGSIEELVALAKEAKIPLPDEALEAIAGGQDIDVVECGKTKCPQCGSTSVTLRTEDHVSYTDFYYTCKSCGYTWMDRSYV